MNAEPRLQTVTFLIPGLSALQDPLSSSGSYLAPGFSEPQFLSRKRSRQVLRWERRGRLGAQDTARVGAPPCSFQCPLVPVPARLPGPHCTAPRGGGVGAARGGREVAFVADAGARRALGLFPRHFPVTFQRGGQFRGGEGRGGEGPAHARCIKAQPSQPPQSSLDPDAVRSAPL